MPMNRLTQRAYLLAAVLAAAGGLYQISGAAKGPQRTEAWMQQTALTGFGKYKTMVDASLPGKVSYEMDKGTYNELKPFGIVARILSDGERGYDVTLIASSDKASFHDPRTCFTAQGWELSGEEIVAVDTKTRGPVEITFTHLKKDGGDKVGAFFYRGPDGFTATTLGLKKQMLWSQFKGVKAESVFYRFIPQEASTTKEQLLAFVRDYLDASNAPTHGYF